jgi:hypothetical protein
MSIPTHETNFLSTAIGELLNHDPYAILSDEIWQANSVVDPNTGSSLNCSQLRQGPDKAQWTRATANEIARLAQGQENGPTGTNTMLFIPHTAVPSNKKPTYLRIVAAIKLNKTDKYRICFTAGGNLVNYQGDVSTPTVDLTT